MSDTTGDNWIVVSSDPDSLPKGCKRVLVVFKGDVQGFKLNDPRDTLDVDLGDHPMMIQWFREKVSHWQELPPLPPPPPNGTEGNAGGQEG